VYGGGWCGAGSAAVVERQPSALKFGPIRQDYQASPAWSIASARCRARGTLLCANGAQMRGLDEHSAGIRTAASAYTVPG